MTAAAHLWAIGYDDIEGAARLRDAIARLGDKHVIVLLETAVVVRYHDGCVTLDGEPFVVATHSHGRNLTAVLAGLALAAPLLTGAAASAFLRDIGAADSAAVGISDDFVAEIERRMKPGTSAMFVLDQEGDMDAILNGIRGLGGNVLKTTVDLERTKLIQSTLAAEGR